ncbi:hypothetical protein JCM4814A_39140 [Streptomyces phaeofaciens JCM 4814]|uniref:Uncharacterized protein n=1 Tax=Streptomyces phaeofaciens TaxID=68254 RepID=A0A918HDP5_9ACTN|nr:hypothetical protein [Streptomyces phaeofaciens]GGT53483.1 hypothetical protein GCM10010226_33260 [Streptomyces phaeofaciens]
MEGTQHLEHAGLPGSAAGLIAALIAAVVLGVVAYALRGPTRPHAPSRTRHADAPADGPELPAPPGRVVGGTPPAGPPGGLGIVYPPMPPTAPGARVPEPGRAPRLDDLDPEHPHHRG